MAQLRERVRKAVEELTGSGREDGVQIAVYLHGEPIVDVCAGVADVATGRPMTPDTPVFSYSTGKGMAATLVHVLADRGVLDYDLRLADVWPEFARHGKHGVTLRHVLTHTAGLPALPAGITPAELTDWDGMCAVLADSRPLWEPGTRAGYHAWTFGWLVGEPLRRLTGRSMGRLLADEVAGPLGVADELFFGVPEGQLHRLATLRERGLRPMLDALAAQLPNLDRVAPPGVRTDAALANRPEVLRADLPAVGTLSARAAARMYAALMGEVDGVRLISPERLREACAPVAVGPDWVFGQEFPATLGYSLEAGGRMVGASGTGGSLAGAAPRYGLALAATKNLLSVGDGDPMEELRALVLDAVAGEG